MSALFACGDDLVLCSLLVMAKSFVASLLFVALAIPAPAAVAAPAPLILKPSSKWQVNYAEQQCRLARQFGEGKQAVLLFMDRYGPGGAFQLTIAGKPFKTFADKGEAAIQFGPNEAEQQLQFLNGNLGEQPAMVFASSARIAPLSGAELSQAKDEQDNLYRPVRPISADREQAVKFLRVGKPLRQQVILETGSMRAPFAVLDKCITDLMTTWGIDVEKHRTLSQSARPTQSPTEWIKSSEHPIAMLSARQPALVNFRLIIGTDGVPTNCHIQATTRPKEFDNAVCKSVMKRARFSPALDAKGQPVATYYQNRVRFQLP
jgi:hypothetical protein